MASNFGTTDPTAQGTQNVNNAASSGNSAIGSFDPNAWQSSTQQGLNNITKTQAAGNQDIVNAFKNQISSQPSATQALQTGQNIYNAVPLQNTANQLNNTMLNTPNMDLASAKGFNYDNNQVQQQDSQSLQRLAPAATAAQNNATTAQNNALAYQSAQMGQNTMNLIPLTTAQTQQAQLYAQQYSGFTATAQAQLAGLQAKMQSGEQLSASEMSAYASLTSSEAQYQSSLASANAGVQEQTISSQNQILPQGSTYYNPVGGNAYNPFATPSQP